MLMNGDSTIHTSRLWSVSAFIMCTKFTRIYLFSHKCKNVLQAKHAAWASEPDIFLGGGGWGLKLLCVVLPTSTPTLPASLSKLVVISEIYFFLLALNMNTG